MADELELWDGTNEETPLEDTTTKTEIKADKEAPKGEDKPQPTAEEKVETKAEETTVIPDKEVAVEFSAEDKTVIQELKSKKAEDLTDEDKELLTAYEESVPKVEIDFNRLTEKGYLQIPEGFTFDGSEDKEAELLAYNDGLKRKAFAEELYNELPEEFKPVLEYVLAGGTDYKSLLSTPDVASIKEEDLSDETKAEVVLHQFYKNKGFSEAKIKKLVDQAKQSEELTIEAKDALVSLKTDFDNTNKAKVEAQKTAKIKEQEEAIENQRIYVNTVKALNEVAGYKLSEADKRKMIDSNLKPLRFKSPEGPVETTEFNYKLNQYMNDPQKFALLQFYVMSDFNIPNAAKRADSEAVKKLKDKLQLLSKGDTQSKVRGGKSNTSKPNFDLERAELG